MAERRMFSKTIVGSDAFLDMPKSSQALYFQLGMEADDDGFLNNAKKITRIVNASVDDYNILIAKKFVIQFPSGVCVIKHWKMNNYIQKDRYKPTVYEAEKKMLGLKQNCAYFLENQDGNSTLDTECIQDVYGMETQVSIGKVSIGKDSIEKDIKDTGAKKPAPKFKPPTVDDVAQYCLEKNFEIDAEQFVDYYKSKGWVIGKAKTKMKDWKAAVRNWVRNDFRKPSKSDISDKLDNIKKWGDKQNDTAGVYEGIGSDMYSIPQREDN